jgi:hypothetical protein
MKRTELTKLKGVAIVDRMKQAAVPGRFGQQSGQVLNRRERRDADQALGLVPFPVKLNSELIAKIHALQAKRGTPLNEVVAELLEAGLSKIKK